MYESVCTALRNREVIVSVVTGKLTAACRLNLPVLFWLSCWLPYLETLLDVLLLAFCSGTMEFLTEGINKEAER